MQSVRRVAPLIALTMSFVLSGVPLVAKEPVTAKHGMVVAEEPIAADVGLSILKQGGNAVDAAVAIGFALAVTHPLAGNIGGGGFMMIRQADGRTAFLDFRETAPGKATRNMYLGPDGEPTRDSIVGWRSSGVPGTVAGLEFASQHFGTKSWAADLAPAVKLARDGFVVSPALVQIMNSPTDNPLRSDPTSERIFLRNGNLYQPGQTLKQVDLANTLERISRDGAKEFYEGETAHKLAEAMAAHGGLITLADLKNYKVIERKPLDGSYKGYQVIAAPPPSAGGIGILQMMDMLARTNYQADGADSVKAIHYEAEVMRRFYADRSAYLGDPAFYNVPVKPLLSPGYIARRVSTIDPLHATPSTVIGPGLPKTYEASLRWQERKQTTHYNVVDKYGNAVAVTYTLNGWFGNGITVPGAGFLLNNEMDDFVAKPGAPNMFGMVGGDANAIEPGKRPVSSMAPTIITKDGKFFMAVGAPGGSRIPTGVLQVILDVLDFGMNPQDAVDLPRFHEQWKPDYLYLEKGFPEQTCDALKRMGYQLKPIAGVARVEAIVEKNGVLEGGTESRLHGKVAGY